MKLYLLNETLVKFEKSNYESINTPEEKSFVFTAYSIPCNLTTGNGATPLEQEDCSRLAQSIKATEICKNGIDLKRDIGLWNLGVKFVIEHQPGNNTIRALKIYEASVLHKIIDQCKKQKRILQLEMSLEIFGLNGGAHFTKWTTNRIPPEIWSYKVVHEVAPTKLPTDARKKRRDILKLEKVKAFFTVCLILDEPMTPSKIPTREPEKSLNQNLMTNSLNKQILEDGMFYDATIVADDGTKIKCHKNFLAQSPVLKTMLQSAFVEGQTSTIKMADMSEKVVRAFLRYIYYLDTQTPEADCQVALDLIKAGDKYDIKSLTDSMKCLFLSKEGPWFTVDIALESFVLARNVESLGDELKRKCVEVLKKNPVQLQELEGFNKLFFEDPVAAKELCLLAMDASHKIL